MVILAFQAVPFTAKFCALSVMDENRFLELLDQRLDSKINDLKRELAEEHKLENSKLLKKFKPAHDFRNKGNRVQWEFNTSVRDSIEEACTSVEAGKVEKAVETLKEGASAIAKRNKLILLADSSSYGWKMVGEYEENELAEDEDDEKKIRRAEAAAERKFKATTRARGGKRRAFLDGGVRSGDLAVTGGSQQQFGRGSFRGQGRGSFGRGAQHSWGLSGPCFKCGEEGHWRNQCPRNKPEGTA